MALTKELIQSLSGETSSLGSALLKTKVLLYSLGEKSLITWVNSELNGYNGELEIPDYRIITGHVLGTATNGYTTRWNNYRMPLMHLDEKIRENFVRVRLGQSVAALEHLAASKEDSFSKPLPTEAGALFSEALAEGIYVESVSTHFGKAQVIEVLTQVRSRLLEFLLELDDRMPANISDTDMKKVAKDIDARGLFNSAIFRGNTTIIVGNNNVQNVAITIKKNDFGELSKYLMQKGVSKPDVQSLKYALDADSKVVDNKRRDFGPNIKLWLKSMMNKAIDTSWQIEIGVAGGLLVEALKQYYGWI